MAILIILLATASYKVCPADRVMVITGPGGRRFVSGGSAFIIPFIMRVDWLSLGAVQSLLRTDTPIPTKDAILIDVNAVANFQIASETMTVDENGKQVKALENAAKNYLNQSKERMEKDVTQVLLGKLREVIGRTELKALMENRDTFAATVAEYLEYKGKLNYKTATSLAKDKDPELRKLAAKHTVASLYWEETDYDVIRYMVENKLADRLCFEHWVKSEDETIRALSAPLAEETDIDPLLDSLSDESAIQVLFNNPEWVKGKRAVRLWRRMGGENRRWIMSFMWDVPDSLIEESLAEPRNWQISSRLEEYKKALQTVARMERLFAKGSEIKRKMRARAGLSD